MASSVDFTELVDRIPQVVWAVDAHGHVRYVNQHFRQYVGGDAVTEWAAFVHPDDLAAVRRSFTRAASAPFEIELRMRHSTGAYRWFLARSEPLVFADEPIWVGSASDVHERHMQRMRLERLYSLSAALAHALTPRRVAEVILADGLSALDARKGLITLISGDGRRLELAGLSGYGAELLDVWGRTVSLDVDWPLAECARTGEAVFVESLDHWAARWPGSHPRAVATGDRCFLALPLAFDGRVLGACLIGFQEPRVFDAAERGFVQSLATQCALALERARLFQEAEMQRSRLHSLFLQAPAQIGILRGLEHRIEFANPPAQAAVGYRPLVGRTARDAFPELANQQVLDLLDRVYRSGEPYFGQELPLSFTNNGHEVEPRFFNCVFQPYLDGDGRPDGIMTFSFDVTEQVRARQRAQAAEERAKKLQAVATALSQALTPAEAARLVMRELLPLMQAVSGRVLLLDETGREMRIIGGADMGEDGVALKRGAVWAGYQAPISIETQAPLCEAVRTGEIVWLATRQDLAARYPHLVDLQSRQQVEAWGAVPLCFEERIIGVLALCCPEPRPLGDVDRQFLDAVARQCAQAIERSRLYERAEAANRAKDDFLAILGHELRNPLSPIVTALQLMKLKGDVASSREQQIIERQVQHLVRLVDDLLDVSRITRGKVQLKRQRVDVAAVVAKAVEMAGPLLEARQHRLTVEVPRELLWLDADETRMAQVIANLLTNAAKYTEMGGDVRLNAKLEGEEVVLSVLDNGVGITREMLSRIFDLFVQGERAVERGSGGLGLGLALVQSLVQLHGGSVVALSDGPGHGSEFVVRLPASTAAAVTARGEVDVPFGGAAASGLRVLVVDDNEDAAELLGEVLRQAGYRVAVAHDGPAALHTDEQFGSEVAILDIGLPVMDGYELARRLRARRQSLTLIALTGYGQEHDRRRSATAGFAHHFVKPLDVAALSEVLARRAAVRAAEPHASGRAAAEALPSATRDHG